MLDLGTLEFEGHNDDPYPLYLPTYAAIAHYHGLHGDRPLREVLAEAEAFAERDYPWALARGARMTADERADAVTTLARLTGLSVDYIDRVDLRIEHVRFFTELLRSRRRTVGRLDGRFLGWDADYAVERCERRPVVRRDRGAVHRGDQPLRPAELGYTERPAVQHAHRQGAALVVEGVRGPAPSTWPTELAAAMRANPHLRLYVASGYHDGATPYFATEHTLAHLAIPAELRGEHPVEYFEAGHMMYVHEPSRLAQSEHLRAFVQRLGCSSVSLAGRGRHRRRRRGVPPGRPGHRGAGVGRAPAARGRSRGGRGRRGRAAAVDDRDGVGGLPRPRRAARATWPTRRATLAAAAGRARAGARRVRQRARARAPGAGRSSRTRGTSGWPSSTAGSSTSTRCAPRRCRSACRTGTSRCA